MTPFHLQILAPERAFYDGDCVSLVVPISDGMLGIMAGRAPLTAALKDGEVIFTLPDGTRRSCAVTRGMLDISRGSFPNPPSLPKKSMRKQNGLRCRKRCWSFLKNRDERITWYHSSPLQGHSTISKSSSTMQSRKPTGNRPVSFLQADAGGAFTDISQLQAVLIINSS